MIIRRAHRARSFELLRGCRASLRHACKAAGTRAAAAEAAAPAGGRGAIGREDAHGACLRKNERPERPHLSNSAGHVRLRTPWLMVRNPN